MSIPDIFDRYLAEESQIELDAPAQDRARFHLVVRDCALSWKRHPKATFHILRGKHLFALQFQGPIEGKSVTLFTFRSAVETGEYRFHGIQLDKLPAGLTPQARSNLERIKELYEAALPGHMQNEGAIVVPVKKSPSIDFLPIVDEARRVVDDGQQEFEPVDESARMIVPAERAGDLGSRSSPLPEPKVKVVRVVPEAAKPTPEPPKPMTDAKPPSKSKKSKSSRSVPTNASMDDLILSRPLDPRSTVVFDSNNWPKVVAPAASKAATKAAAKSASKSPSKASSASETTKALPMSRLPQSANPTPQKVVDLSKWMNRPIRLVQTDEKPEPKPATKAGKAPPRPPTVPAPKHGHAAKAAAAAAAANPKVPAVKPPVVPVKVEVKQPAPKALVAAKVVAPAKAVAKSAPKAAPAAAKTAPAAVKPTAAKTAAPKAPSKPVVAAKAPTKSGGKQAAPAAKPAPKPAAKPVKAATKPAPKKAAPAAVKPAAKASAKSSSKKDAPKKAAAPVKSKKR